MRLRIEAPDELTPEEAAAVRAALERYAAAGGRTAGAGHQARWTRRAREEALRGRPVRLGGRAAWQGARDRRRREATDGPA